MVNRFSELRNKEIIHVCEGTRLGYLNDVCIDTDTGTVRLRAEFPNEDERLFPNQFLNVRMQIRSVEGAIVIPAA